MSLLIAMMMLGDLVPPAPTLLSLSHTHGGMLLTWSIPGDGHGDLNPFMRFDVIEEVGDKAQQQSYVRATDRWFLRVTHVAAFNTTTYTWLCTNSIVPPAIMGYIVRVHDPSNTTPVACWSNRKALSVTDP